MANMSKPTDLSPATFAETPVAKRVKASSRKLTEDMD